VVKTLKSNSGFTLLEVMISLTLFGVFIAAYFMTQGYNISDSILNQEQLTLQMLAEKQMNEIIIKREKLTNAQVDLKETKTFEEKEYSNYQWTLEYKKLEVPDFGKIFSAAQGADGEAGEDAGDDTSNLTSADKKNSLNQVIFDRLKDNLERILWQVRITVTNKETKYSFALSRWIVKYDEPVQLNLSF
jgi:prepilin-type N-terminal cleavage/methylation domain-containing protein